MISGSGDLATFRSGEGRKVDQKRHSREEQQARQEYHPLAPFTRRKGASVGEVPASRHEVSVPAQHKEDVSNRCCTVLGRALAGGWFLRGGLQFEEERGDVRQRRVLRELCCGVTSEVQGLEREGHC